MFFGREMARVTWVMVLQSNVKGQSSSASIPTHPNKEKKARSVWILHREI